MNFTLNKIFKILKAINIRRLVFSIIPLLLAFFVPFVLTITLFTINGFSPLASGEGVRTILMVDMQGQYIAFFRYYKMMLNGEYNFLYTLGKTSGGNMLSIFTYYLASPFNLLLAFFSIDNITTGLLWIIILKISVAGVTSYIALSGINKNGYVNLIFSFAYALVAYNFIYYSNIMWLDGVLILPLVGYGILRLIHNKKTLLYVFSLSYAIATSWYIGIMIALFSVLFFLMQYISKSKKHETKWESLLLFTVASLAAGFISIGLWGSALLNIFGTKGATSFTDITSTIKQFYTTVNIERGFVFGGYNGFDDIKGTTIAFYIGAIPMVLTLIFFGNTKYTPLFRISALVILGIYVFAFFNKGVDHLFHGGPAPNWFPARYSFVFSFLLIYFGSISLKDIRHTWWPSFILPIGLYIYILNTLKEAEYTVNSLSSHYFTLALLLVVSLYLIENVFYLIQNKPEFSLPIYVKAAIAPSFVVLFSLVSVLNLYDNANHILNSFNDSYSSIVTKETLLKDESISKAVNFIKEQDTSLYRVEKSFIRTGTYNNANNDSMYYGYNGLSHYSSTDSQDSMNYMKRLGFLYNGFNMNYANGSTLAINSYLGVKYFIDNGANRFFDFTKNTPLVSDDFDYNLKVYENPYVLPFLFSIEDSSVSYVGEGVRLEDNSIHWFDKFEYQNNIFKTITRHVVNEEGKPKDIFKKADYTKTLYNGISETGTDYTYNVASSGSITYRVTQTEGTNYYYYIDASNTNNLSLITNGQPSTYFSYHGYQINGLKYRTTPSAIQVTIDASRTNLKLQEAIYYEDLSVLGEYVDYIKNNASVDIIQKSTSRYESSVVTTKDNQYMLLTLPMDSSFKITVNGKKVETTERFNIFTGFTIPTSGINKIVIKYLQPIFSLGIPFGIICAGLSVMGNYFYQEKVIKKRNQFIEEDIK